VLLPVHEEIIAMVPTQDGTAATSAVVGCMQTELAGVPIIAEADEPSYAWTDVNVNTHLPDQ
jgi:hypothetical protein